MAQDRFCSQCGTARQEDARFCVSCGHQFGGQPKTNLKFIALFTGGILVFSFLIYFGINLVTQKDQPTPDARAAAAEHTHTHAPDPKLDALEQKAANGSAADAMELAGYLVEKGLQDQHYLMRATEVLESLLEKHPRFALGLRTLGNLYYDLGQPERAEVPYRKYLELYPNDANYRTDYGTVLLAKGQTQAAIDQYKQAIAIYPDHYHASFNLSIAYQKAGDKALSQEYRDRAAEIDSRVGKTLAPEIALATLPDGEKPKPSLPNTHQSASGSSDFGRYTEMAKFFLKHEIVGPKMTGFDVREGRAVLSVREFPMEAMPPFARDAFDKRVMAQLDLVEGDNAALEIRDTASGEMLASYPKAATP